MTEIKGMGIPQLIQQIMEMASGTDFGTADIDSSLVGEGEEVLGEMTPFEKACSRCIQMCEEQAKKVDGNEDDSQDRLRILMRQTEIAHHLRTFSVLDRLDEKSNTRLAIRAGWKIVKTKKDDCDCPGCRMSRGEGLSMGRGVTVISIGFADRE